MTTPASAARGNQSNHSPAKPVCCHPAIAQGESRPCKRKPLWHIRGVGYLCHFHYEAVFESGDIDVARVARLSDGDRGFAVRCKLGTRRGSPNGGGVVGAGAGAGAGGSVLRGVPVVATPALARGV